MTTKTKRVYVKGTGALGIDVVVNGPHHGKLTCRECSAFIETQDHMRGCSTGDPKWGGWGWRPFA